ncbi:MAG: LytR/AlgR family response regulator transcription factor [Clostridiales bacterium]
MKVIIIEDEAAAYNNMVQILKQIDPTIEILANFDTVMESVLWFRSNPMPDLIFMDIQLADGSSFNIFDCVNIEAPVIFTTAYDEYAIDAFQVNSVDYLLKPITLENTKKAIEKLNRIKQISFEKLIDRFSINFRNTDYNRRILVPVKDKILSVDTDKIAYFYNTNGITEIIDINKTKYKIDKSLDSIIMKLDPAQFIRANRQYIVSKRAIKDVTIWFDSRLLVNMVIDTPEQIFVSKNRACEFKNWYAL